MFYFLVVCWLVVCWLVMCVGRNRSIYARFIFLWWWRVCWLFVCWLVMCVGRNRSIYACFCLLVGACWLVRVCVLVGYVCVESTAQYIRMGYLFRCACVGRTRKCIRVFLCGLLACVCFCVACLLACVCVVRVCNPFRPLRVFLDRVVTGARLHCV
jgi:hypothetical protein